MGIRGMPCGVSLKKKENNNKLNKGRALNFPIIIFHEQRNTVIFNPLI